jgi:hypothetical protein
MIYFAIRILSTDKIGDMGSNFVLKIKMKFKNKFF